MKSYTKNTKKSISTRKKLVLNLNAIIRYVRFPKFSRINELQFSVHHYFLRKFHIKEEDGYITDYEIVSQNSDFIFAILVAVLKEDIKPFMEYKPISIKLSQIEAAKALAKRERGECFLYTLDYYFHIKENTIVDVIDSKIFTTSQIFEIYNISKIYFDLP